LYGVDTDDEKLLRVEISGPGTKLHEIDPLEALTVARAYFDLIRRVAAEFKIPLHLQGLALGPGSTRLGAATNDAKMTEYLVKRSTGYLEGAELAPASLRQSVADTKKAIRALPVGHLASVLHLKHRRAVIPGDAPTKAPPPEFITVRATLISVGGVEPKARFTSRFEHDGEPFSVDVTPAQARLLGACLYSEVEVSLRAERGALPEAKICAGHMVDFVAVEEGDGFAAWKKWFQENASQWNDVADIETELGRD
jgi:hypothetical protein